MTANRAEAAPETARRSEHLGWCWYDWANSVFPTSITTVFLSLYLTDVAAEAAEAAEARNGADACPGGDALRRCAVEFLGWSFPAGSLWGYLLSLAAVIQVLVLPLTGALVDRTGNKRRMLAVFAFGGATATALLALTSGQSWRLGAGLFVLANVCFGASVVVYYSLLPEIATADERDALSARGWAFGYLGGGVALAGHLVLYTGHETLGIGQETAVRLVFVSCGLWWAVFTLLPLAKLRDRAPASGATGRATLGSGFRQLAATLRQARRLPLTLAFLGAYMIFTDGISTVFKVSAQYGSIELGLSQDVLITTILVVQFIAFLGGVLHGRVAAGIGAKRTIMISLSIWVVVLIAAFFTREGEPGQFYGVAAGIGLVLGGTNALSRSLFSQMIPRGKEAEYFSLYQVGERSTSWLGPLVFAAVGQATGSFRLAIISLIGFFVLGLALVSPIPVGRAIRQAGNEPPEVL
ncbi:UMF1 family MFS transporter [Actinopolyspora biskrensis]|uniref:UMF1 family MFS transporter n=1 Tax=Actinopolyspora biskrensis TaxID=1470178 RepID=A0A852YTS0_9ACTN|nr:MFS transporter [Actinopolyspora biskrensis]NYH77122.1 UMF1 family MFS transporter [Actinopolyspora biskrensis]